MGRSSARTVLWLHIYPSRTLLSNRRLHPTDGSAGVFSRRQECCKRDSDRFGKAFSFIPDLCVTFAGLACGLLCRSLGGRRGRQRSPDRPSGGSRHGQRHELGSHRTGKHRRTLSKRRLAVLPQRSRS